MTTPRDRLSRALDAPALHLVRDRVDASAADDGDAAEELADAMHSASALEEPRSTGSDGRSSTDGPTNVDGPTTVDQARSLLAQADPATYYRMLTTMVRSSHSSVLQELPYTPALSFHDPSVVVVEPEPTNIETLELYARAAYPDFDKVLATAFMDPLNDHLLTELYHLLVNEGENVAMVTNHGQIIDIALVIGALQSALMAPDRSFGVLGQRATLDEMAERCNVLVSRMVTTRQAFNVPALQVLQCGTRTYLTVPQTANRRRSKLDPELARANNTVMRYELDERLAGGGQLLAMAASGSQDLALPKMMQKARSAWRQRRGDDPGEVPTLHLQPLYDGTISLMRSCRYVLPVAICLDPASPACVLGGMTRVREKDDCHRIMDWIALAHQEATGTPTIYHWHEDDLLTQVRAFLNR